MQEYDFLQAKLHGIHARSIVGNNFNQLKKETSADKIFKKLLPEVNIPSSEQINFTAYEKEIKKKIFLQINYIAGYFNYKNQLINNMILRYELDNVKLLLNAYHYKNKEIRNLFEVDLKKTLNYQLIYASDLTDLHQIKIILRKTIFSFLIPLLEANLDIFRLENRLDQFYYQDLLNSLNSYSGYEQEILKKIIYEEMNWQNILWAFRTKIYYGKNFTAMKDTFLKNKYLIPAKQLEKIYSFQFIPHEVQQILKGFPTKYFNLISQAFTKEGDFDLINLEENMSNHMSNLYSQYFFRENFNILPIISYIYLKKIEYSNVVKIIESIRYRLPVA